MEKDKNSFCYTGNSSDKLVDCLTKERASCEKLCDVEIEINSTKKHKLKHKKIKERERERKKRMKWSIL